MTKPIEKWATYKWPVDENWRKVPGFSGYEVSDHGRIRSLRRANARLMNPEIDKDGYSRVALVKDGRYEHQVLSRLVAIAFIGLCPEGKPYCCHEDGVPSNNRPSNLRWDSQAGNISDKLQHGTHQVGSKHPRAQVDESQIRNVKRLLATGATAKAIAATVGISVHIVNDASRGRSWRQVSC